MYDVHPNTPATKVNDFNDISEDELASLLARPLNPDAPLDWYPEEVPVFFNAHVRGWPDQPEKPSKPCRYQSLVRAYTGDHKTDAHTAAYTDQARAPVMHGGKLSISSMRVYLWIILGVSFTTPEGGTGFYTGC